MTAHSKPNTRVVVQLVDTLTDEIIIQASTTFTKEGIVLEESTEQELFRFIRHCKQTV